MIKTALLPILCCLLFSCSPKEEKVAEAPVNIPETTAPPPAITNIKDVSKSSLLATGDSILGALKKPDLALLSKWVHPEWKLHFSPYGYIDKKAGQTLDGTEMQALLQKGQDLYWGDFDGSGNPINLSLGDYLKEFVLDRDFRNAPAMSVDSVIGRGNTLLNTKEAYPEARVVEYYFPGEEIQGFMDWKTLRLLFQQREGKLWLVCIAHDEWTI